MINNKAEENMGQDVFGNILTTALFGKKIAKKQRDICTGKVKTTTEVEVRSSPTGPITKLQKKIKKKAL